MKWPLALLLVALPLPAFASPVVREEGVIYLSDFSDKPLRVQLEHPARAFFEPTFSRYAGTLRFPQNVELVAVTDHAYRVRGIAQQGQILGWIPPDDLEPLEPDFLANLRAAEERRRTVEALIAKKEIAIGMTPDEVQRSLGRPQKTSNRITGDGSTQVWEYISYELVPQQTTVWTPSGPAVSTTYIRVPTGTLAAHFHDGVVSEIDQSEGNLFGGKVTVVVPPLFDYW